MYSMLIVDDEPLVQMGLRSMLQRDFSKSCEVIGTASNGRDALHFIEEHQPDIVFADIKMPVMSGLELLEESRKRFGALPVFIILTAYEDFSLVRKALTHRAADYIIKIELNPENLKAALQRSFSILQEEKKKVPLPDSPVQTSKKELQRRFLLRILRGEFEDKQKLTEEAKALGFSKYHDRYIVVFGEIQSPIEKNKAEENTPSDKLLQLYTTSFSMTQEIIHRHCEFYALSYDLHHFILLFYFDKEQPVADQMTIYEEALDNARSMIHSYFNASLFFGIGTVVNDPLQIAESFQEAKAAQEQCDENRSIRRFSHIVGANRRSGKDRLISEIQKYIDENLSGKLLLNEIAEQFGLSPAYLSVLFKKNTEIGFSEYVYTRKIEKAKQMLLSGDMKIYEVADALGFESAYYFSKVFKKVDGHSPRDYIQKKTES